MSDKELTKAIYNIANVLEDYDRRHVDNKNDSDITFATCQLVARTEGLRFYPLPEKFRLKNSAKEVETLCEFSHIQFRKIKLSKDWERESNTSFIGYQKLSKNKKQLVALIQNNTKQYEIHNLKTNKIEIINNKNKQTIGKESWVFYRHFLSQKMGFKEIFSFLSLNLKEFRSFFLLTFSLCCMTLIFSTAIGQMVDSILPFGSSSLFIWFGGFLFLVSLSIFGLHLNRAFSISRIFYKIDAILIPATWDRLLKMPVSFFREHQPGDLILRVYSILGIRSIFSNLIEQIFMLGTLFFYCVFIFFFMPQLIFIIIFFVLFYSLFGCFFSYYLTKNNHKIITLDGKISNLMLQLISGIYKLKTTSSVDRGYRKWSEMYAEKEKIFFKNQVTSGIVGSINEFTPILMTLCFFSVVLRKYNNNFDIGLLLILFYLYQQSVLLIINITDSLMMAIESAYPEIKRIRPLFMTPPEVDNTKSFAGVLSGKIEVNQVSFSYGPESPKILNNLTLQIQPGEFIGITGGSGSGKSTLLRLLLGFEKPNSGSIYYDDHDVLDSDITAIRRQIGVVLQNSQLVAGSIFQNIVGSLSYTHDDAWEVAKLCGLDKDISQMPMGMHTWICEGAHTISGGQRKLILLARAFLTKPKFIFLDEATSVLDNQVQNLVMESLAKLDITRVVIAHRLSTLKKTHRIFVLKNGEIIETGSYHSLIESGGYFSQLAKQQHIIS